MKTKHITTKQRYINYFWIFGIIAIQGFLLATPEIKSEFPASSSGSLSFTVDICQFDGPDDSTAIEVFYSVYLSADSTPQSSEDSKSIIDIDLKVIDKGGKVLTSIIGNQSISLYDSLIRNNFATFMDLKRFNILADTVILDLKIQESSKGNKGQVSKSFKIKKFDRQFSVSDLYFASHIQRSTGTSVFDKGGVMLFPNPLRSYINSGDNSKIFVYFEINNLSYNENKPTFYETNSKIQDLSGKEIFTIPNKLIKVNSKNTSRINVIPFGEFNSGIYRLCVEVTDIETGKRNEVKSHFQVDNGEIEETKMLPMSEEEEKKYFNQIKYIATDLEKDVYQKLDPKSKQDFLFRFWKTRDPNPTTTENEFMIEHFSRLDFVEREIVGGANSDMGRVYIVYGAPVDIERQNATLSISAQSIEIWSYSINGRTDFIFVDRDADGKFVLVHSTHKDEYYDPNWRDKLQF